jgi:enoyl-CoA hydratase
MADVTLEIEAGIATVTLDAPARRNALTVGMADDLVEACEALEADPAVAVAVLQATGPAFCAGADRALLAGAFADPAGDEPWDAVSRVYRAFARFGELRVPSVAAVRGHAVGAGLNLALAADLRVVGQGTRLSSGFLRLGLHPGGGHFALLTRSLGPEAAAAIGLFGEEIDGARAVELGLAWTCVADDRVEATARRLALGAARDPELARAAKASLRASIGPPGLPWPAAIEMERGVQMRSFRRRGEPRP